MISTTIYICFSKLKYLQLGKAVDIRFRNLKNLTASYLAISIFLITPAQAMERQDQEEKRFALKIEPGLATQKSKMSSHISEYKTNSFTRESLGHKNTFSPSCNIALGLYLPHRPHIRTELSLGYLQTNWTNNKVFETSTKYKNYNLGPIKISVRNIYAMASLFYTFENHCLLNGHPFIFGGLGITNDKARLKVKGNTNILSGKAVHSSYNNIVGERSGGMVSGINGDIKKKEIAEMTWLDYSPGSPEPQISKSKLLKQDDNYNPVYKVGVGLTFPINKAFDLDISYSLSNLGQFSAGSSTPIILAVENEPTLGMNNIKVTNRIRQEIGLGLRISF